MNLEKKPFFTLTEKNGNGENLFKNTFYADRAYLAIKAEQVGNKIFLNKRGEVYYDYGVNDKKLFFKTNPYDCLIEVSSKNAPKNFKEFKNLFETEPIFKFPKEIVRQTTPKDDFDDYDEFMKKELNKNIDNDIEIKRGRPSKKEQNDQSKIETEQNDQSKIEND
jgi:hypothetical protein